MDSEKTRLAQIFNEKIGKAIEVDRMPDNCIVLACDPETTYAEGQDGTVYRTGPPKEFTVR